MVIKENNTYKSKLVDRNINTFTVEYLGNKQVKIKGLVLDKELLSTIGTMIDKVDINNK